MRKSALLLLCFCALFGSPGRIFAAGEGRGDWRESTAGRWESLPERRAGATDNGISVEVTMLPGTGIEWTRDGRWSPGTAHLRFSVDNVNAGGNDYLPAEAAFPASVTFVFGKDSLKLGVKKRILQFFRQVWHGFSPPGIRLTYAWGNGLPVGSMYRLWEEETVFVVAGPEEAGTQVSTSRRIGDDFQAAYGRPPTGPVTKVLVSARRPSREKGPVRAAVTVRLPGD